MPLRRCQSRRTWGKETWSCPEQVRCDWSRWGWHVGEWNWRAWRGSRSHPEKCQQILNMVNSSQFVCDPKTKATVDISLLLLHCELIYVSMYSLHPSHLSFRSFLRVRLKFDFLLSMFTAFTFGTWEKWKSLEVNNNKYVPKPEGSGFCVSPTANFCHFVQRKIHVYCRTESKISPELEEPLEGACSHRASFSWALKETLGRRSKDLVSCSVSLSLSPN